MSAATDTPTRLVRTEEVVRGADLTDELLRRAAETAGGEVQVSSDQHGSADYKKHLLRVYLRRAIRQAMEAKK